MYIYQNGKLYVQDGGKLVGVDISPLNVTKIKTETGDIELEHSVLTPSEMRAKFTDENGEYKFPRKKKVEGKKDDTVRKTKPTTGKSTRGKSTTGSTS